MKIVIDARMINMSGIGRYLRALLPSLIENIEADFVILGKKEEINSYISGNVSIINLKYPIYHPFEHFDLKKNIPECDIYFSPHFITPFFKIPARNRITTIHDLFHLSDLAEFSYLKKLYLKIIISNAIKRSTKLITVSNFSRNEIINRFPLAKSKIEVIYNSIDRNFFRESYEDSGIEGSYALFVGNIKPHKNIIRLLEAFKKRDNKNLKLVIVGEKEGFISGIDGIENKISKTDNIIFTGKVNDNKLLAIYSHADFLIFPSLYEGFGFPPLEAMSCRTIVTASQIEVVKEICGDAVVYFDPLDINDMKNKINILSSPEFQKKKLIKEGERRANVYSPENFINQHIKIFSKYKIQ
ncbi:MAG: glycosyltransferase family 4 protein [Deltaproteobacteria bacterium]|nr:glycosyltransferase family 4 protein [Deltaproteobacteria bacterium]